MQQIDYLVYKLKNHLHAIKTECKYIKNIIISFDVTLVLFCSSFVSILFGNVEFTKTLFMFSAMSLVYIVIAMWGGAIVGEMWDDLKESYNSYKEKNRVIMNGKESE